MQQYSEDREAYRRWPRPTRRIPALRRRAPTVRFITFETLVTGVRAFECAFSVRTSSFVHGLMTRRAVVAFTVLADFVVLTAFFKALGIIQVLHLNAAQIGTRCGDKKTDALTYSILSDNWYVIVLPQVEEEIRRVIRNERAKDRAHRSVRSWATDAPGAAQHHRLNLRRALRSAQAKRAGDEAQTALHVRRGFPATDWNRCEPPMRAGTS